MELTERVNPIKITDKETNRVYVLDFDRDAVIFAENRGFDWDEVGNKPATLIPFIWYVAFRRYDKKISMEKTTKLLEELGGMKQAWLLRLRELYNQSMAALIADPDLEGKEDEAKNGNLTVELD